MLKSAWASNQSNPISFPFLRKLSDNSGNGADGDRMIAAENQRRPLLLPDFQDQVCKVRARVGDFFEVFRFWVAEVVGFRNDHVQIAEVLHLVSQRLKFFVQIRISQAPTAPCRPRAGPRRGPSARQQSRFSAYTYCSDQGRIYVWTIKRARRCLEF